MTKSFARTLIEDRRLILLRETAARPGGITTSTTLKTALYAASLQNLDIEQVEGDLAFLERAGLVALEPLHTNAMGVRLTERGEDYLRGGIDIEGLSAPRRRL
jgi:hypothetical protein